MKRLVMFFGAVLSVFSIVLALWIWQRQSWLVEFLDPTQPLVMRWSMRCLAVGLIAAAQMTIVITVVAGVYRRSRLDRMIEWLAAGVFGISLISAAALGLVGK